MWSYISIPFQLVGNIVSYVWNMFTPAAKGGHKAVSDKPAQVKSGSQSSFDQTSQMLQVLNRLKKQDMGQSQVQHNPMSSSTVLRHREPSKKDLACVSSVMLDSQIKPLEPQSLPVIEQPKPPQITELPNIKPLLDYNVHLKPLMQFYHGLIDPSVKQKECVTQDYLQTQLMSGADIDYSQYYGENDWGCISTPDGSVCSVVPGGCAKAYSGSLNIKDAYYRALAECILNKKQPKEIRVASVINHNNAHFTSSVATINIARDLIEEAHLKLSEQGLLDAHSSVEELMPSIALVYGIDPSQSFKLAGATNISIDHYDSLNPGRSTAAYYSQYLKTLGPLVVENPVSYEQINARPCKQQRSNTCGDHSMWNIYHAGILGLDIGDPKHQLDSYYLRAQTYKLVYGINEGHPFYELSQYVNAHALRNLQQNTIGSDVVGAKTKKRII